MNKICAGCGTSFSRPKDYSNQQWESRKYCSLACFPGKPRKAKLARYRNTANGSSEHRDVMESVIGRKLDTSEYVHHRNGVKTDNNPENLEVMDPVTHGRLHHLKHPLVKKCENCGSEFTPHKTSRKKQRYCSHSCHMKARNAIPMGRAIARAVKEALESIP